MMIEVNKNLYLNADGSKGRGLGRLQEQINDLYGCFHKFEFKYLLS